MKVALVRNYMPPASGPQGAERVVENICQGLIELGHEPTLVVPKLPDDKFFIPLSTSIPDDVDIVHYHGWDGDPPNGSCGKPWVLTIHGGGMETDPQWLKYTTKNPHIICVSKFISDRLQCPPHVWTCSSPKDFTFEEKKSDYFLWMAGTDWGEGKGLFTTIRLAKRMRFKLKIAGSGKNQQNIDHIKSLCDDKIEYAGEVNGKEKAKLLSKARGFFLLTRLPDACPTVVGESMLSGTPIIGSSNGSVPELINPDVGFVCKTETEVAKAVLSVSKINPKKCRKYGENCFSHVVSAKKHVQYYRNMLKFGKL